MAGDPVIGLASSRQSGVFSAQSALRVLAAGAETASRRRIDRARDLALQHDAAVAAHVDGNGRGSADSSAWV